MANGVEGVILMGCDIYRVYMGESIVIRVTSRYNKI